MCILESLVIHTYLPTYLLTYLYAYITIYLPTHLPTCIHTYIHLCKHYYIHTHAKNIMNLSKDRERFGYYAQDHANSLISAIIHQCNIAFSVVHVHLFINMFFYYYYSSFLPARVASNLINILVLPVGLYEWKTTSAHPIPTIMFENILRTFEAEILKIVKNIQPQSQNLNFKSVLV